MRFAKPVITSLNVTLKKTAIKPNHCYFSDLDECMLGAVCPSHSQCFNYNGGYRCTCDFGYEPVGALCEGIIIINK